MAVPLHQIAIGVKRIIIIVALFLLIWVVTRKFLYEPHPFETRSKYNTNVLAGKKVVKGAAHRKLILSRKEYGSLLRAVNQGKTLGDVSLSETDVAKEPPGLKIVEGTRHLDYNIDPALGDTGHENVKARKHVSAQRPCTNVHAFYYPWYGNPKKDGHYSHWNHMVLPHWDKEVDKIYKKTSHEPPNDIASDFYPELGAYSSRDPHIINEHFSQLASARIGVIAVSYYPSGTADENGKPWDDMYSLLLDKAAENSMKVTFHIEPYKGRNAKTVRDDILHIVDTYGSHKGFYRYKITRYRQVPLFYVYDSYLTRQEDWAAVLQPDGPNTIRGTKYDSMVIGLLVEMPHSSYVSIGGFDGLYTYFASNGFTYGSRWDKWKEISTRSHEMNFLFIPSVGPGYIDTNIRPWNSENTRGRLAGGYYKSSWGSALEVKPKIISITSFNEWHEGTQIEKAIPKSSHSRKYFDYEPFGSDYYLKLTRNFIDDYQECM